MLLSHFYKGMPHILDDVWVTLWLVTLVNHNVTRVLKNKKKLCERERKKPLIISWLTNVITTTMSPKCYPINMCLPIFLLELEYIIIL